MRETITPQAFPGQQQCITSVPTGLQARRLGKVFEIDHAVSNCGIAAFRHISFERSASQSAEQEKTLNLLMAESGAGDVQGEMKGIKTSLCDDCRNYDHSQHDFNGNVLRLCVEGQTLQDIVKKWGDILEDILIMTCAARNTSLDGRPCWVLLIHIKNPDADVSYPKYFIEKLESKLKPMMLCSNSSEIFSVNVFSDTESQLTFLNFSIFPDFVGIAAKNLHSPQSYDHCLLNADLDCIVQFLFCRADVVTEMVASLSELHEKTDGEKISVQESASVQFKSLQPEENKQNMKKTKSQQPQEVFNPTTGGEYVEWLWNKQTKTLGEYLAGFAKIRTGGIFYCGVREDKGTNKIKALSLPDEWKQEIREKLEEKIKEDMLWVQRDPNSSKGYTVLQKDDIERSRHFDVDFIPVRNPSTEGRNLYILEVRMASFDGVVFNHKGPEVYEFQEDGGSYKVVPVDPQTWLQRLQQHAWCSKHRIPREPRCGFYDRCSQCRAVWSDGCSREALGFCNDHAP